MDENNTQALPETVAEQEQGAQPSAQPQPELPTGDFMSNPAVLAYIDSKVQEGIQKALQGTPPKASTVNPTEHERKSFEKMPYKERLKLFQSDLHTYKKLSKGTV